MGRHGPPRRRRHDLGPGSRAAHPRRLDEDGTRLAVWVSRDGPDEAGQLSLYDIDPATGRADLDHPTLDKAPAYAGFALHPGRLAWSAPTAGGDTSVEILAWDGTSVGTVSLPAEDGTTILR